jgi:hypothetical protein
VESKIILTELKVKTDNLDELRNFDWEIPKKMFQDNDPEKEITLVFSYINKSINNKSKTRVENFEMKYTCKNAELEKLIARLKKSFDKMFEIDGQTIKN